MSKLYTENGFLSEEGKRVFKEILDGKIASLLRQAEDENELRLIGSLILKRVGDLVSDAVLEKKQKTAQLNAMSDEDFEQYLENKYGEYGENWILRARLTPEEQNRSSQLFQNKFKEWEQNQKSKSKKPHYGLRISPREPKFKGAYNAAQGPLFPEKYKK